MTCDDNGGMRVMEFGESHVHILELTSAVRRVALFHLCPADNEDESFCLIKQGSQEIRHSRSPADGGTYVIYRRSEGYPPKSA